MNQPFSPQALATIVGATLAVALLKVTTIVGATFAVALVTLTDKCRRPGKASKRHQKIRFQNATDLKQIAANAASGAGLRLWSIDTLCMTKAHSHLNILRFWRR